MPTPTFQRISVDQFQQLLTQFDFTRRIDAVHMHHTWKPSRADFKGHETIVAMWRFHTQTNGWRDIAQHITIDPEGFIWLGRNWNLAPASAAGHNGNATFGPFMFEMVGNFDVHFDRFDGPQKDTTLKVIASVQQHFGLASDTLRFHNMMSAKSCPGTSLDRAAIVAEVDALKQRGVEPAPRKRSAAKLPFPDESALVVAQALRALARSTPERAEPGDAELSHDEHDAPDSPMAQPMSLGPRSVGDPAARDSGLSTAQIAALRPYLINLTSGRFSTGGEVTSSPADVDAIFEQHLPAFLQQANGQPARVVFYAHGGLVSESHGLQIAQKHIGWWLRNGVYPIYFVWETGFFRTIAELIGLGRQDRGLAARGFITDPVIEVLARAARGPSIWGGMKANGERACEPPTANDPIGGGAHYTARKLAAFCAAHPGQLELHAVGHSAGAVFHAHLLPLMRMLGVPTFKTAHFMAPAVRADTFKDRLLGQVDAAGAVESLTVFTMQREFERKDNCAQIYRKSLLYLIFHALEDKSKTPILGLEESLRDDAALAAFFGLKGTPSARASVVWSPSLGDTGRSASQALAHGDFDDDAPTMTSIARRVLDKADADPIADFPAARALSTASRSWFDEIDWPEPFGTVAGAAVFAAPFAPAPAPALAAAPPASGPTMDRPAAAAPASPAAPAPTGGRRLAVCVGIDAYPNPEHRLSGCVNDARRWDAALRQLGFETALLVDGQATRAAIAQSLRSLVDGSHAGDVIAFQYSGHGTTLPDLDGDEADGTDEALCPVDFEAGALYIDDDLADALARLPEGVNLTFFMDCCHSGTNTRFAAARPAGLPAGTKARFVRPTPAIIEAHKQFRTQGGRGTVSAPVARGQSRMRDIKFAACLDHQVAMESGGSGEFTLRALRLLEAGIDGVSNAQFLAGVVAAFGPGAGQTPMLDCAEGAGARGLLQPAVRAAPARGQAPVGAPIGPADGRVIEAVNLLARAIDRLTAP